jgi:hypothetical protein
MNQAVLINRKWAMPSHLTFSIKPINQLIDRYVSDDKIWIDPFANDSVFNPRCKFTNDLREDVDTTHHLESLAFLEGFDEASVDGVLFDPPYSPRQISECYKSVGREVHMQDTQASFYGDRKNAVARAVKSGGIVICCGWNSGGMGASRGFDLIEILLVPHGGAHNDTIVTVERKR